MDDSRIIKGILQNNEQSFRDLIEKYEKLIYVTSFRILRTETDAEDICQEVFLEVFRSIHKLKNEDNLSSWLFKIAKNKSISLLRKRNPAKALTAYDIQNELTQQIIHKKQRAVDSPVKKLEDTETRQLLFEAIDKLPDKQKQAILMHKFEDYSHKEICAQLNLSSASVESLIYRAKNNLKKSLFSYFKNHLK